MADSKNQHFVPQFYLRNFSRADSKKLVGALHLPSGRYVPHAKISDHACDDYFYGKDGVEEALQKFESALLPLLSLVSSPARGFPNGSHRSIKTLPCSSTFRESGQLRRPQNQTR